MTAPKKPQTLPRKKAQQARSVATVEALLEATTRILVREGYDRASTNRIAEAAGTSVGSLYQYFPSKEALVAELIERHIAQESLLMLAKIEAGAQLSAPQMLQEFISFVIQLYGRNKPLRKVFIEQVPKIGKMQRVWTIENEIGEKLCGSLFAAAGRSEEPKTAMQQFVLIKTIMGVIRAATLQKPQNLDHELLALELSAMLIHYLNLE